MSEGLDLGIAPVDRLIQPPPEGSSILFVNEPGVEAEPFLYEMADSHLASGRKVLYMVTTRAPSSVIEAMQTQGVDVSHDEKELIFIDCFSALLGAGIDGTYGAQDPSNLEEVAETLAKAADDHPDAVLLVDSLSGLADHTSAQALTEAMPTLLEPIQRFELSGVMFTDWGYGMDDQTLGGHFDGIVRLGSLEERVTFGQYFKVDQLTWQPDVSQERHPYKVYKPGGVHVYIPKIVVTGPYNAGKSTFVHAVSDTAVSVDRLGTTVALDHGHVTVNGVTADIFGTPGQARFDPILRTVAGQALGIIVLVDATKPDTLERATDLLNKTVQAGIPLIVGANKQDAPGALSAEEIRERLDPPSHVQVIGVTGRDPESAMALLETMNHSIVMRGATA